MPTMPPAVSTSSTRMLRCAPNAWPCIHGDSGHGTRSNVVRTSRMVMSPVMLSPPLPVIHAVRPHVGGRGDAVRHVEEAGDGGNVPDVAVGKTGAAQQHAVGLVHGPWLGGELHGE